MSDIPAKVVYTLSAEVGLFLGMGVILFHSLRIVVSATKQKQWKGFRDL